MSGFAERREEMRRLQSLAGRRLLVDISLWSANLARLGDELLRVGDFTDLFHFDVSDGRFAPGFLFFPDLIAALRALTSRLFHAHLMVEDPAAHVDSFIKAGADIITLHAESAEDVRPLLEKIRDAGCMPGIALRIDSPIDALTRYISRVDLVLLMGTPLGIKGCESGPEAVQRVHAARKIIDGSSAGRVLHTADGAIRSHSVPGLYAAGADVVTPGSLVFGNPDLGAAFSWLHQLRR
jgi:ribulose-phosphate 3-epimerase